MSVQNLATVFGPNILRPKIEDPVAIMEGEYSLCVWNVFWSYVKRFEGELSVVPCLGTVLVQQLMAILIGRQDVLFPHSVDSPTALELVNNNFELPRRQAPTATSTVTTVSQNAENNNTQVVRQCVWEAPESPPHRQHVEKSVSPRPSSPRSGVTGRFDIARSPPLTIKKNPAYSKGSGIVTNGSFSSSPSSDPNQEKSQTLSGGGSLPMRRSGALKGSGTKMGTSGVAGGSSTVGNGVVRMGISGTDVVTGGLHGRNGLWAPNGCVTLRVNNKTRDGSNREQTANQNRLSTYDNVQLNHQNLQLQNQITNTCLNSSCEDKQSVDSATWSTSSCEISLPDNSTSCRSSTTTCPEQDFYGGHYEDLDGPAQDAEPPQSGGGGGGGEGEGQGSNREAGGDGAGSSSRGTSSSENSDGFPAANGAGSHSALHSLVASLKQEMHKQKTEYEARIKRYDPSVGGQMTAPQSQYWTVKDFWYRRKQANINAYFIFIFCNDSQDVVIKLLQKRM